jgi:malate synthase
MKTLTINEKQIALNELFVKETDSFILTGPALEFLTKLHVRFNQRRKQLLKNREEVQLQIDSGLEFRFPENTAHIRAAEWKVAPLPEDLLDRRVEITGPVDRKMIINALNSGAKVFMADFEDSTAPSWTNIIEGQENLYDAIRRQIDFYNEANGKTYALNEQTAVLMVRPRGLHLEESSIRYNEEPMSGSLVDFGLYFFHNAHELLERGSGPYFYLPKLEHYKEARWWNEVFDYAQELLGIKHGTIKATVLVETITASFQLDEILYELRCHSAGLNCGRWDYIFSFIKRFRNRKGYVFPDRDQVTMGVPFMEAYSKRVIQVCHKRNVHAMGGMAAQIPIKNNPAANEEALNKVRKDKLREVKNGHDGTWVAHPALVEVAMEIFDEYMPTPNQIKTNTPQEYIRPQELVAVPSGEITELGIRKNLNVGIQYLSAWLSGYGAAAIHNLMEDAATAEISRAQLWQWLKAGARLNDGRHFNDEILDAYFDQEVHKLRGENGMNPAWKSKLELAADLYYQLITAEDMPEFLTLEAYDLLD